MPRMPVARRPLSTTALLGAAAVLTLVFAAPVTRAETSSAGLSQDAAVAMVREQAVGKVVRVERQGEGAALVYLIRVLTPDGRLREYRVDAATGTLR